MDRYANKIKELKLTIENVKIEIEQLQNKALEENQEAEMAKQDIQSHEKRIAELKHLYDCLEHKANHYFAIKVMNVKIFLIGCIFGVPITILLGFPITYYFTIKTILAVVIYFFETHNFRKQIKGKNKETVKTDIELLEEEKKNYEQIYQFHKAKHLQYNKNREDKCNILYQIMQELENLKQTRAKLIDSLLGELLEQSLDEECIMDIGDKPFVIKRGNPPKSN